MGKGIIVIGIDGGTWDLIIPWTHQNELPTFQSLLNKAAWGELQSTIPPTTAPAWATFLTGRLPSETGIYDFYRYDQSLEKHVVNYRLIEGRDLIARLEAAGRSQVVVNVPMTYPPRSHGVNTTLVSGMLTPTIDSCSADRVLIEQLKSAGYKIEPHGTPEEIGHSQYIENVLRNLRIRKEIFFRLIRERKPDFAMCVFRATDILSHRYWHLHDPNHPIHNEELHAKLGDPILAAYRALDELLDELLDEFSDYIILLVSDHGFGPEFGCIHLNTWLLNRKYIQLRMTPATIFRRVVLRAGFTAGRAWTIAQRIRPVRRVLSDNLERRARATKALFLSLGDLDLRRSRAFAVGSVGTWGLVSVRSEGSLDALLSDIESLTGPESDEPLLKQVHGPLSSAGVPNLILEWRDGYVTSPYLSRGSSISPVQEERTGCHRSNGLLAAYGPKIRRSTRIHGAAIQHVRGMILEALGIGVEEPKGGNPLLEVLE